MNVQSREGEFTASGGLKLFYRAWTVDSPRGVFLINHGLGEHSGRYKQLANELNSKGFSCYAYDIRGHGKSPGVRGHVDSFDDYYADFDVFRKLVIEQQPNTPLFLFGHSLGGTIIFRYTQVFQPTDVRGVCISSPVMGVAVEIPKLKLLVASFLKVTFPKLTMNNGFSPSDLSHDSKVVDAYVNDPLVHDLVSSSYFFNLLKEMKLAQDNASEWTLPIAILYAGDDKIVSAEATEKICSAIDSKLLVRKRFDGFYHEILNEVNREKPLAELFAWVEERLK